MVRPVLGLLLLAALLVCGCALGPRSLDRNRLRYNEAVKTTTEEQLLLNIVRLRYTDTPSSLAISSIADQAEIVAGLHAIPFFAAAGAGDVGSYRGAVLPQAEVTGAIRPTLTYTPLDDQEFTRRLFTPITLDGVVYLGKTTWPISTVFRLWLENLNWVSNAENASGPTPRTAPEFVPFQVGIAALQRLQDRRLAILHVEEREERLSDGVGGTKDNIPTAQVEAAKAGFEYRQDKEGRWAVVRKKNVPILRIGPISGDDADWVAFCQSFHLDPEKRTLEVTTEKLDPFLKGAPERGLDVLDLETRSLLQVLFFVAHGVCVPPEHVCLAPQTLGPDGQPFPWAEVFAGLFKVCHATGHKPPAEAHVAVRYRGYWFYIDERDRDTKSTFALLVELSRLELGAKAGSTPILTLPLGGR
jgi:hypothetical protein